VNKIDTIVSERKSPRLNCRTSTLAPARHGTREVEGSGNGSGSFAEVHNAEVSIATEVTACICVHLRAHYNSASRHTALLFAKVCESLKSETRSRYRSKNGKEKEEIIEVNVNELNEDK